MNAIALASTVQAEPTRFADVLRTDSREPRAEARLPPSRLFSRGRAGRLVRRMCGPLTLCVSIAAMGCLNPKPQQPTAEKPSVAPATQPQSVEPLALDASVIKPMYTEMMAIDLPTVVTVATARNFDIQQARQAVEASRGRYESQVGAVFPALVPTALFEHVEGTVRATEGNLVRVGFNTFQPSLAVQWVVNPGRVIYDLVAAKKRLSATEHDEDAVMLATLRRSAIQFYEVVLAQARVSAAKLGVKEAQELARIMSPSATTRRLNSPRRTRNSSTA